MLFGANVNLLTLCSAHCLSEWSFRETVSLSVSSVFYCFLFLHTKMFLHFYICKFGSIHVVFHAFFKVKPVLRNNVIASDRLVITYIESLYMGLCGFCCDLRKQFPPLPTCPSSKSRLFHPLKVENLCFMCPGPWCEATCLQVSVSDCNHS